VFEFIFEVEDSIAKGRVSSFEFVNRLSTLR
jgi:hypothetical protein